MYTKREREEVIHFQTESEDCVRHVCTTCRVFSMFVLHVECSACLYYMYSVQHVCTICRVFSMFVLHVECSACFTTCIVFSMYTSSTTQCVLRNDRVNVTQHKKHIFTFFLSCLQEEKRL